MRSDAPVTRSPAPVARKAAWSVLLALGLAACGKADGPRETQVAARVNKGEISVHQLQNVLQRQPRLLVAAGDAASTRVLEVLIDQELAAQAARAGGLDADPTVIQSLLVTQREVLARAYHDRVAARATNPSSDEIDRYYAANPQLFAQRRLYLLQETAIEATPAQVEALRPAVMQARTTQDVGRALSEAGLRHSSRMLAHAAEDLPLTLLEPLARAEPGQSVLFTQPGGARIFTVVHAQKAPVERRVATDAIANYLVSERKRELVAEAMKALRQTATVSYLGAFAGPAAAASAPVAARASAPR